jgi:hypothetical protein
MVLKELLAATGVVLTFVAYLSYIASILHGTTRPHAFSWIVWGATTFIAFLGQMADSGGPGTWPIGVSGLVAIVVAVLAYLRRGDHAITRVDWAFFIAALASLPLWWITKDPLSAVVVLTAVDLLGFGPTIRRAFTHPYDEQLTLFVILAARNLISIAALQHYSLTTVLFPGATAIACVGFVALVAWWRRLSPRVA